MVCSGAGVGVVDARKGDGTGIETRSRAEVGEDTPGAERNDGAEESAVLGLTLRFECERENERREEDEDVEVGCEVGARKEDDVVV